ncbi:DUF6328 family protein [Pseudonocardia sp. NPDC046786]|uniref:DUF6328 family protein n=1 Tax=Pseudonocardia sp. NPDC046786 TaxID=3155471 RepID=UPI0034110F31
MTATTQIPDPDTGRQEGPLERADRNMAEILQELRVTLIGIQILFAFLLSFSFSERFRQLDAVQLGMYLSTLLLSVVATGLLVAPAAVHRMSFARGRKPEIVRTSHRCFLGGLAVVSTVIPASVALVLDVAVSRAAGIAIGASLFVFCLILWFVLPLPLRRRPDRGIEPKSRSPRDACRDPGARSSGAVE